MADPSIFGNYFSSVTGMGNPMTPQPGVYTSFEEEILKKMDPTILGAYILNRKAQDIEEDPNRFREKLQIAKEYRLQEANEAARIQAERDKRNFQYQLAASIPKTITEIGSNLAQMRFNAPRLQILADTPGKMIQAYGSLPRINVPSFR